MHVVGDLGDVCRVQGCLFGFQQSLLHTKHGQGTSFGASGLICSSPKVVNAQTNRGTVSRLFRRLLHTVVSTRMNSAVRLREAKEQRIQNHVESVTTWISYEVIVDLVPVDRSISRMLSFGCRICYPHNH
jgi:hypothetical protein